MRKDVQLCGDGQIQELIERPTSLLVMDYSRQESCLTADSGIKWMLS